MAQTLSWDDLILQHVDPSEVQRWLQLWADWLPEEIAPVFLSRFGDWFLRHPDGRTSELSVIEGTCREIASTPQEFEGLVNDSEWQEEHLLAGWVQALHEAGKVPGPEEGYGFSTHPQVAGRLNFEEVQVKKMGLWQEECAAVFRNN